MKFSNRSLAVLPLVVLLGLSLAACSSATSAGAPFAPAAAATYNAGDGGGKDIARPPLLRPPGPMRAQPL